MLFVCCQTPWEIHFSSLDYGSVKTESITREITMTFSLSTLPPVNLILPQVHVYLWLSQLIVLRFARLSFSDANPLDWCVEVCQCKCQDMTQVGSRILLKLKCSLVLSSNLDKLVALSAIFQDTSCFHFSMLQFGSNYLCESRMGFKSFFTG